MHIKLYSGYRAGRGKCIRGSPLPVSQLMWIKTGALLQTEDMPCPLTGKEIAMFKVILIPTDGSELSERAIRQGVALAKALGATVVGLTVAMPFSVFAVEAMMTPEIAEKYEHDTRILTRIYLSVVEAVAKEAGVPCITLMRIGAQPHQEIIKAAEEQKCDAICMASHGRRGVSALVLGSETVKVLTHSRIPVIVVR